MCTRRKDIKLSRTEKAVTEIETKVGQLSRTKKQQKRSLEGGSPLNNQEVWYRGVSGTQYVQHTLIFSYYSKYCSIPGSALCLILGTRGSSPLLHTFFFKRPAGESELCFFSILCHWTLSGRLFPTSPCCTSAFKISVWSVVALSVSHFSCTTAKKKHRKAVIMLKLEKSCIEGAQGKQHDCSFAEDQER